MAAPLRQQGTQVLRAGIIRATPALVQRRTGQVDTVVVRNGEKASASPAEHGGLQSTGLAARERALAAMAAQISLARDFRELADRWHAETDHLSVERQKVIHPAYQMIVGMGLDAVPFMLEEMRRKRGGWWSWALQAIARGNPAEDAQSPDEALAAWEGWARGRGLMR